MHQLKNRRLQKISCSAQAYFEHFVTLGADLQTSDVLVAENLANAPVFEEFETGHVTTLSATDIDELLTLVTGAALQLDALPQSDTLVLVPDLTLIEWMRSFVSNIGRMSTERLKTGALADAEWPRLTESIEYLRHREIQIVSGCQQWSTVLAEVEQHLKKVGTFGAVVFDSRCVTNHAQGTLELLSAESVGMRSLADMAFDANSVIVQVTNTFT